VRVHQGLFSLSAGTTAADGKANESMVHAAASKHYTIGLGIWVQVTTVCLILIHSNVFPSVS
jgi:hypothetical protein